MSGRTLGLGIILFTIFFAVGLIYTQFFAFYERVSGVREIMVAGQAVPVHDYDGIDASSSGLKMRACFRTGRDERDDLDPVSLMALPSPENATPLNPPFWFDCFDAAELTEDLAEGRAFAVLAEENEFDGIDRIVAFYPSGRGYMWRQLNAKFQD